MERSTSRINLFAQQNKIFIGQLNVAIACVHVVTTESHREKKADLAVILRKLKEVSGTSYIPIPKQEMLIRNLLRCLADHVW